MKIVIFLHGLIKRNLRLLFQATTSKIACNTNHQSILDRLIDHGNFEEADQKLTYSFDSFALIKLHSPF